MHKFTNRLSQSASPYLLQHAHNPVDWFEWGSEALEKARKEDKPILVSIGYSSCHWCHVMERESFENEDIAKVMNEFFVCIKVDREERPDIDSVYMEVVQALGVHGGWPLNIFITPEQKPFFGGTYFSPVAWKQILNNIDKAFKQNRDNIEHTAEELREHLLRSDVGRFIQPSVNEDLKEGIETIYKKLESGFDHVWGGLDKAPKFIMPSVWHWILRYHYLSKDQHALDHVVLTLKKIAMGGIYDQVGGGFSRYSVDGHWFVPHFEKMLYDNAQLISLYAEAYSITKDEEFKTIVYETFGWLTREMTSERGGFYSALDADSEGVEGKFYCWIKEELNSILGSDAPIISSYYSVSDGGNWEHGSNILIKNKDDREFLHDNNLTSQEWSGKLSAAKKKLLEARAWRIRPGLDDKIITSWNAMMICGLATAYKVFADRIFIDAAIKNITFIEKELTGNNTLFRSYKDKPSTVNAFLDDYAYLIKAYIELYQCTFDEQWIKKSERLMNFVLADFYDGKDGYFQYSGRASEKLITSKKEIFDNVIPASNSVMVGNLFYLGTMLNKSSWEDLARTMTGNIGLLIKNEPNYMSNWAIAWMEIQHGLALAVMVGEDAGKKRDEFHKHFQPFTITMGTTTASDLELVADKKPTSNILSPVFICYNRTCQPPVDSIEEANDLLSKF